MEHNLEDKRPSEQVESGVTRRKFSPEYKLKILQEIDASKDERGSVGKILRREGLFASQVASWRRTLEEVIAHGFPERKRGRKVDPTTELRKKLENQERKIARLQEDNRQYRLIIEAQKKIAEMYPDGEPDEQERGQEG